MTRSVRDILAERYEQLDETVKRLQKEVQNFPDGRVSVKQQGNRFYYYHVIDDKEKYLNRNESDTIRALVQKAYVDDVIKASEIEMNHIKALLDGYCVASPEDVFNSLSEARKMYVTPVYVGNRFAIDWANEPYEKPVVVNGFRTLSGYNVRSKSELIIADRLWIKGIPFRYECPLMINGKIIHPDFTILRRSDNKLIYHEHCGMIDKPEYAESMVTRIFDYNKEGIYIGDRLFITCETSKIPLDITTVDNLIETHFR